MHHHLTTRVRWSPVAPAYDDMLRSVETSEQQDARVRTFVLVLTPAALVAWQVGFELGAFDVVAYGRIFAVFVVSIVVLTATFVAPDSGFASSWWSRLILSLPLVYLLADVADLTESRFVTNLLGVAILLTFPYVIWVAGQLMGFEFFALARRDRIAVVVLVAMLGVFGWYVGQNNERFVTCRDFIRMGDYVPENCAD